MSRPTGNPRSPSVRRGAGPAWVRPLVLAAAVVWLELALRVAVDAGFGDTGVAIAVLFAVSAGLAVHLVASLTPRPLRAVVTGTGLGLLTLVYLSQFVYFQIFRTYYSVYSAANAGQVAEFAADVVATVAENGVALALIGLPPLALVAITARLVRTPPPTWGHRAVVLAALLLSHVVALALVTLGDRGTNSPHDLYYRSSYPVASVSQLGLVTTMRLDLVRTVSGFDPVAADLPPVDEPPPPPPPVDRTPAPTPGTATAEPRTYNALDIDFAGLAEATSDATLKGAHTWFARREPTATNDHTGLFEGYNLIFITAEGYSHYAVRPDVTPTLYAMTHQGVNFRNFYNPLWGVSTSDGEYVATTGLIPKPGVWSMARSGRNAMPWAMGNQLGPLGYTTLAYHNHTYDYYDRHISHPNLGYTYKGLGQGLVVEKTWPESDLEMMEVTVDEYIGKEPFHAYYMTVSGHLRYTFGGNHIARKNRDLVADLPYSEAGRAYLATQIELDRALELLLTRLEEAGVAERTLIALSADHYPYGLNTSQIEELAGQRVDPDFELYRSSFLLYAPGMEPETVDRPVSSLDILPTLSNLMGLEFDSRLLMGVDAFCDAPPLVIFHNRSFISDLGRYNARTREFTPAPGATVPDGYRERISTEVDQKFHISRVVLDTDYYAIARPR